MNILIVDDHNLVLEGFSKILQDIHNVENIDAFATGTAVCDVLKTKCYDIYIIDLKLPDIDGFDLIEHIRAVHGEAKILVCTMVEDAWVINRLIHSKVNGIVFKSSAVEHIGLALQNIAAGKKYYCKRFEQHYARFHKKPKMNFTPRELEVLGYIIEGMTSIEIAAKIGVSDNAVEGFRKSMFEKTGVRNAAQLVAFAYENKII